LLKLRAKLLAELPGPLPESCVLPPGYELTVASPQTVCAECGTPLRVQHSCRRHPAGFLLGRPRLRHQIKQCPTCSRRYGCDELREWLPPYGNYTYEVIVAVGLARYRDQEQEPEIGSAIARRHRFHLPRGSIEALANRFPDSFLAVHLAHADGLRERLAANGGYVMHLDGTCEAGTKVLFVALDGVSGTVLLADALDSENPLAIRAVVDRCVALFGLPLALVSDLSDNLARGTAHLPGSVKRLLCHYHFLARVGERLLQSLHAELTRQINAAELRPQFRSLRRDLVQYITRKSPPTGRQDGDLPQDPEPTVRHDPVDARRHLAYTLLRWLDDHGSDLRGESFPFDQPALAFHRRAAKLRAWLRENLEGCGLKRSERTTLQTILEKLETALGTPALAQAAQRLEKAVDGFEERRCALRFERSDHKPIRRGQPPASSLREAAQTASRLQALRQALLKRVRTSPDPERVADAEVVLQYLDKYESRLHGHAIRVPDLGRTILVERTNNAPEPLFGRTKRGWRRRLGTRKLVRRLQAARPEELRLANLDSQEYLQLCYQGDTRNIAAVFSRYHVQAAQIRRQRTQPGNHGEMHIPKATRRQKDFFQEMAQALKSIAACFM